MINSMDFQLLNLKFPKQTNNTLTAFNEPKLWVHLILILFPLNILFLLNHLLFF